jgi:hypothetical protein
MKHETLPVVPFWCSLLAGAAGSRIAGPPSAAPKREALLKHDTTMFTGLIPGQNVCKQQGWHASISHDLRHTTGVEIKRALLPRYGTHVTAFASSGMDCAFFRSIPTALFHEKPDRYECRND